MPKVLIVGQGGEYNLEGFTGNAFEELGWVVRRFDSYLKVPRESKSAFRMLATRSSAFRKVATKVGGVQRRLEEAISLERPDLLLVCKGELFPLQSALNLKKLGIHSVLWYPDDPRFLKSLLLKIASVFDLVVVSSKSTLATLHEADMDKAIHLPFGCDPKIHRSLNVEKTMDVSFVGTWYPERSKLLSKLAKCDLRIWGAYWRTPFVARRVRRHLVSGAAYGEEYVRILNRSRITINMHHATDSSPEGKPNMRVFEASGCGSFQLTDSAPGLTSAFEPNKEIVCYNSPEELVDLVSYYIDAKEERNEIARAAQHRAYAEHTYVNRVASLLTALGLPPVRSS